MVADMDNRDIIKLTLLRDTILAAPDHFNMRVWANDTRDNLMAKGCDTAACIGGWASALFFPDEEIHDVSEEALVDVLGVAPSALHRLFYPVGVTSNGQNPFDATNVQAARVLDHLIETGRVDWDKAFA